jgi:hypothetical protein
MASAKDIIIPVRVPPAAVKLSSDAPSDEVNAIFRELRKLVDACGPNQHDCVDVLITALIHSGFDTGPRIIGAAKRLDVNGGHAGIQLRKGIGHRWSRDEDGKYLNLI